MSLMLSPECLSLLWPTAEKTDLLRACLWSGDRARDAWGRWQDSVGDAGPAIKENVSGVRSLLPLLHHGLRGSGGKIDLALRSSLAAAALTETLRWDAYAAICVRAFDGLSAAAVPFLVLKGAALAVLVYPEAALRHSHDVDLLVDPTQIEPSAGILGGLGFSRAQQGNDGGRQRIELFDQSGLPIELHGRLYRFPYYTPPLADIWARSQSCEVAATNIRTLSAADHLLYVCGQASCLRSRDSLKWVADAWYLIHGCDDLDWEVLLQVASETRIALPLAVLLRYLAGELEARIPSVVLERLCAAASTADVAARQVALTGLRAGKRGTFRNQFGATHSWRGRLELVRWMLAPSPTSLRLGEPLRYPSAWPAYYVARPLAYAARRLLSALRR
jgi:hypothetical protein